MSARPSFRGASELPADQADLRREQGVERAISGSLPDWLKSGRLVTATLTDATEAKVSHGLGRGVQGWFLGKCVGDADRVSLMQTASDGTTLTLVNRGATGGLSVTLWVY